MFGLIRRCLGITTMGDLLRESEKFDNKLKNSIDFSIYSRQKITYLESKLIHVNKLRERYKNYIILDQKDLEELYEFKSDLDIRLEELAKDLNEEDERNYARRLGSVELKIIDKTLDELKTLEEITREDVIEVLRLIKCFLDIEVKGALKYI